MPVLGPHSAAALARSGVPDLRPRQVRDAMASNGWPGIAIVDHDAPLKAAGKAPTMKGWQRFAAFGGPIPSAAERAGWDRSPSQGPGTGIPCGGVIGIDIDVSDPALVAEIESMAFEVFGATPFVRQGRAPRSLLVYLAAAPMPKQALKANDGSGDGIDIMGEGSQFVAFGIHAKTCRPYEWTGAESPLTASPEAAPIITASLIEAFLDCVRAVLPLSKTGGRARGPSGQSAEIIRDAEGFVVDGRELWMSRMVWGAVTARHLAGEPLTEAAVLARAWAEFLRTSRVEVAGRQWTEADCAAKVRSTLDRVTRKVVKLPVRKLGPIKPTYPDNGLPLAEAEAEVARIIDGFFEREAPMFKSAQTLYELKYKTNPLALPPAPTGVALRVEAGIGKTEAAIRATCDALRRGVAVIYAVPTVELGDAITARFAAFGIKARVWRGREQSDPEALGERMCRDLQAAADARRAGAYSVAGAVCSRKPTGGSLRRCRFFDVCGHVRQRSAEPSLWVVTHAMLFRARPAAIPRPNALVIDESFFGRSIPDKPATLAIDVIARAGLPDNLADARSLQRARFALAAAFRAAPDGPVTRADLAAAGIAADLARDAKALEWGRYVEPEIVPNLAPEERENRVDDVAGVNSEVKALAALWNEVAELLDGDFEASGRLMIAKDKCGARVVRRRSLKTAHGSWHCPTLILDATAPSASILSIALGLPVEMRASIRARWSEHGRVSQLVGAPVTSNALGANGQGGGSRNLEELVRYVALRSALAAPAMVGVVIQKDLVDRLKAHPLPANVDIRHFGALAGLDHWSHYGGVIIIGRTAPPPGSMELSAAVLTGRPIEPTSKPFATGGMLLRDGSAVAVPCIRLADPIAEELRWQICEGNLIQAIGRIRPLRRGAPFFVDVLCDVPLPLVVDGAMRWEDACPGPWATMAATGVIFSSVADIMAALPDLAPTADKARWLLERSPSLGVTSKKNHSLLDVTPDDPLPSKRVRRARVKRKGCEPTTSLVLPNAPQDRRGLRLGPLKPLGLLDLFEIEGEAPRPARGEEETRDLTVRWQQIKTPLSVQVRSTALASATQAATRIAVRFQHVGLDIRTWAAVYDRGATGVTSSELLRDIAPRPSADELSNALAYLVETGQTVACTSLGKGRPSVRYFAVTDDDST